MNRVTSSEQQIIDALQASWVWVPGWVDSSNENTAGRVVKLWQDIDISSTITAAVIHCSADTRYKLYINGVHVAVGPSRGSTRMWHYDTLDLAPYLTQGPNQIKFLVVRYFAAVRGAMPFGRTSFPGLTVSGHIQTNQDTLKIASRQGWKAQVLNDIQFPLGLIDDVFLHISERVCPRPPSDVVEPQPYEMKTLNGDLLPWRLRPRRFPMQEMTNSICKPLVVRESTVSAINWTAFFLNGTALELAAGTTHILDLQADVHSTAFLKWCFRADAVTRLEMKMTFSEGYESEPRSYPFFRTKNDRLDWRNGHLIGPYDEVVLDLPANQVVAYEPFWFRTFRVMRIEISVGAESLSLQSFTATQTNYPLTVKASWDDSSDDDGAEIWDVSVRTLRNCMFDGYSDCPFYEQLQYSGDSRSVGLFHYLLSGDDCLMRQTISMFAVSVTAEGLTQSRYPSHVPQIIASFPLYWILQVSDHYLYFGDRAFTRSFLPRIDGVLEFFETHVDELGLVAKLPSDVWQYVDWVTTWGATDEHPDKGVPTSGRESNRHTFFSLIYAWVLQKAANLVKAVGRPGYAQEYEQRANAVIQAVRKHCHDGHFITDSTADIADELAYSQHCQVFGVLTGTIEPLKQANILRQAFAQGSGFSKCSYVMQFYALRAFTIAGDGVYEEMWTQVWNPWRRMLRNNLTTWEEDDVRQRSDCHAWGSVPIYEFCTEVAGVQPVGAGCSKLLFAPRLTLSKSIKAKVALGNDNLAVVSWHTNEDGSMQIDLRLERAIEVQSQIANKGIIEHGILDHLMLLHYPTR